MLAHLFTTAMSRPRVGAVLDGASPALGAWSFSEQLYSNNPSPPIRVRRAGDNLEADIPFVRGRLDQVALLRHAGENRFIRSGELTNTSSWPRIETRVTDGIPDPSGGLGAFRIAEFSGNNEHYIQQTFAPNPLPVGTYLFSAKIRANNTTRFHLRFFTTGAAVNTSGANWNFSGSTLTNTAGGFGNVGATTFESMGDGWWFVTAALTVPTGTTSTFVRLHPAPQGVYVGDPTRWVDLFEPQIVAGTALKGYAQSGATGLDGTGQIVAAYDQSGGGRHLTQATATKQPIIVSGGVIETRNGVPAARFDAVDDVLVTAASLPTIATPSMMAVINANGSGGAANGRIFGGALTWIGRLDGETYTQGSPIGAWTASLSAPRVVSAVVDGSAVTMFRNGAQSGGGAISGSAGGSALSLGDLPLGSRAFDGWMTSAILWPSTISIAERMRIERRLIASHNVVI